MHLKHGQVTSEASLLGASHVKQAQYMQGCLLLHTAYSCIRFTQHYLLLTPEAGNTGPECSGDECGDTQCPESPISDKQALSGRLTPTMLHLSGCVGLLPCDTPG